MSEQSILIADQTGGKAVATRDALMADADSNSRVIQLVDFAGRRPNFIRIYAADGGDTTQQIIRGDETKIVISIKATASFTKITLQVQLLGLYQFSDEKFAVHQVELLPANLHSDVDFGAFTYSAPLSFDLDGASVVNIRAWGDGFDAETGFYLYAGLV